MTGTAAGARAPLVRAWRHNRQQSRIIERFLTLFDLGPEARSGIRDYLAKVVAIEQADLALALESGVRAPAGPSPVLAAVSDELLVVFGVASTG